MTGLTHWTVQPSTQPAIQAPNNIETDHTAVMPQGIEQPKLTVSLKPASSHVAKSIAKSATTLAPQSFQRATAPSVVSQSKTIALGSHQDLSFPPAPAHTLAATEVICPFCLLILPIQEVVNEKRWKSEILHLRMCTTVR